MSRFGDEREFQNELSEALQHRAKEVGNRQAIGEVMAVVAVHCDHYWADEDPQA